MSCSLNSLEGGCIGDYYRDDGKENGNYYLGFGG